MDRRRLIDQVTALGVEFSRLGMPTQCRRLRLYYLALKHGLDAPAGRVELTWSPDLVLEWLRVLRVPPHHEHYPVWPDGRCRTCGDQAPGGTFTTMVFPGGSKSQCRRCGGQWLVLREETR